MFKYVLLLIVLWLAFRLVRGILRVSFVFRRVRPESSRSSVSSSDTPGKVQEAEYEVIESHIKKDE
ncbi:MAG: heme biosynthesis protein HemY [Chlorobiaceae bacterium]|nr:heme biosynthesis protein HemY [Chlorobiaceae bacterium]